MGIQPPREYVSQASAIVTAAAATHCQVRAQEVVAGAGSGRPARTKRARRARTPAPAPVPARASGAAPAAPAPSSGRGAGGASLRFVIGSTSHDLPHTPSAATRGRLSLPAAPVP